MKILKLKIEPKKVYSKNKIFKMLVEQEQPVSVINFLYSFDVKYREKIKEKLNYLIKCNLISIKRLEVIIEQRLEPHGWANRPKNVYSDANLNDVNTFIFITDKGKDEYKDIKDKWKWWLGFIFTNICSAVISAVIAILFKLN